MRAIFAFEHSLQHRFYSDLSLLSEAVRRDQLRIHSPEKAFAAFVAGFGEPVTEEILKRELTVQHVAASTLNAKMQYVFGLDEGDVAPGILRWCIDSDCLSLAGIEEINHGEHFRYDFTPKDFSTRAVGIIEGVLARERGAGRLHDEV